MDKMDFRAKQTHGMIETAFLEIIADKGYSSLTVTELCKRAGLSRKAFYTYFETKEDLYDKYTLKLFSKVDMRKFLNLRPKTHSQIVKTMSDGFENMRERSKAYYIMFNDETNHDFKYRFEQYLREKCDEIFKDNLRQSLENLPRDLIINTVAATSLVIIQWWISNPHYSSTQAAEFMFSLLFTDIQKSLGIRRE